MRRSAARWLLIGLALLAAAAGGGALWARAQLMASLPQLDGQVRLAGLSSPVAVTRDALGIPTVRGRSREDVARATGFLHAQDRFFQMDLSRRRAAGELAALAGPRALVIDREVRVHRFRAEARKALSLLSPRDRTILDAYVAGVNGGLASLRSKPFEYFVLRQEPQPWLAEDSLLVVLSMFITLQDSDGSYESTLTTMHDVLPQAMFDFLAPRGTEWDAPVVGPSFSTPAIPGRDVYDLRARRSGKPPVDLHPEREEARGDSSDDGDAALGSNNFAVSGRLTPDRAALVANDMHLSVRVPNTWYRAALEWTDGTGVTNRLIGVTLPGVPALVVGSNTYVAWGFTNTYADWVDLVVLDIDPSDPGRYRTPDGWRRFEEHGETIEVAGGEAEHETVRWTIWGPVVEPDHRGRSRALRWVAHSAERLAQTVTPLEAARTLEEAFDSANGLGTPGQNMVVADRSGRIGWTVYGSIPRRVGLDDGLAASWADGTRRWDGWLEPGEYPRLLEPEGGRIWTANARVVDGEMLARLGDGSYEVGSRARAIRDRLMAREQFTPRDLLSIQLDAHATFLARWRDLLLQTLTPAAIASSPARSTVRELADKSWTGEATPDSAAYRLVRMFREQVSQEVMAFVLAECYEADATFDYVNVRRREGPIWKLVTEKPQHLLDARYHSWDDLLLRSIDVVIQQVTASGATLTEGTWARYNVTAYRHPLSPALPFAGRWLDMRAQPLPGDLFTPRMHWGAVAASERMIVSPGKEEAGIMHMPTGQSGHPLSPFYGNSHEAWVKGEPTPFLPGPAVHTVTLQP